MLVSQGVHRERDNGVAYSGLIKLLNHLSYVQIDTISVVERAHHHTCWSRIEGYRTDLMNQALRQKDIFEYWSHAAAYLPMRDYRFSLPRKQAYLNGERHWYDKDAKQMRYVKDQIAVEGAMRAKDFDQQRVSSQHAWGGHKPAKMALEQLFMQGDVMVVQRDGFQKVFDLTERVIPNDIDQSMPTTDEYHDHLIFSFLNANGIGSASEIAYLRKGLKLPIQARCEALIEDQKLVTLRVNGQDYFALSSFEMRLKKRLSQRKVKILSPFDNLLIQRQRMRDVFDFDYQIECYVPAKKRRYGYFVLPILGGQRFIGRLDAKIDRKTKRMTVFNLFLETKDYEDYLPALKAELKRFLSFNQGTTLGIEKVWLDGKDTVKDIAKQLTITD